MTLRPRLFLLLFVALGGAARAQNPAPWPAERTGSGLRGAWQPFTGVETPLRDGILESAGGDGDSTLTGLPSPRQDLGSAPGAGAGHGTAWWSLDRQAQVLFVRMRLAAPPLRPAVISGGLADPAVTPPGANPWSSGAWSLLVEGTGDGFLDAALVLDGESGGSARDIVAPNPPTFANPTTHPLRSGDDLLLFTKLTQTQAITRHDVATGLVGTPRDLAWHVESALQAAAGAGGSVPDGFAWDLGFTRCVHHDGNPEWGDGWMLDLQIPRSAFASARSALPIRGLTPVRLAVATADTSSALLQRDIAAPGAFRPSSLRSLPFGDVISFGAGARSAPTLGPVEARDDACGLYVELRAQVADALRVNPASRDGVNAVPAVLDTISSVRFEYWHDADCNGQADDGGAWQLASVVTDGGANPDVDGTTGADGVPQPGFLANDWAILWDTAPLPDGCYLVRVLARDDSGHATMATRLFYLLDRATTCSSQPRGSLRTYRDVARGEPDASFSTQPDQDVHAGGEGFVPLAATVIAFYRPGNALVAQFSAVADAWGTLEATFDTELASPAGNWTVAAFTGGTTPPAAFDPAHPQLLATTTFAIADDTDRDGLTDAEEAAAGSDPIRPDGDFDGVGDAEELQPGIDGLTSDPLDADTDDDGLGDAAERALGTDPAVFDTDGDGLGDGLERGIATAVADPDGAGPLRGTDLAIWRSDTDPATTTDPRAADSDRGGVPDGLEDRDRDGAVGAGETDPLIPLDDADADDDGVPDDLEPALGTSPASADTDGDGLLDGEEILPWSDGIVSNPLDADTDDDGLPDARDAQIADASRADTDGDGIPDGIEAGVTRRVADPDGLGPLRGTDGLRWRPDADPSTLSDPRARDTDGGGADDGAEDADRDGARDAGDCDPSDPSDDVACMSPDADGDGLSDAEELRIGSDPALPDTDGDMLPDGAEIAAGSSPLDRDSDDDGLDDRVEVQLSLTSPVSRDSDGDGISDGVEEGFAAPVPDPDGAGPLRGTGLGFVADLDPLANSLALTGDTDGGGALDGNEDLNGNGRVDPGETDPGNPGDDTDGDGDGIPDACEVALGLDPAEADTDGDGLSDGDERVPGSDGSVTSPFDTDTDDDGLADGDELLVRGTDPARADTDGDGLPDGLELGLRAGLADPDGAGLLRGTASQRFRADGDPSTTTDPTRRDTDEGGAWDGLEDADGSGSWSGAESLPWAGNGADDADSDADRMPDVVETSLGLDPFAADTDGDGIDDGEELAPGDDGFVTDPLDVDSDDDGLSDGDEILFIGSLPDSVDSDGDGVQDGTERGIAAPLPDPDGAGPLLGTDPGVFVFDGDPVTTTDALLPHTDGGSVADGAEDLNGDGTVNGGEGDPVQSGDDLDADLDGIADAAELVLGTDPALADTDADGLTDGEEILPGADGAVTDPLDADTDDDGIADGEELPRHGTSPILRDSDGDGLQDGTEAGVGSGLPDTGGGFERDTDTATTTSPEDSDTDEGGAGDGAEDEDGDGRNDVAETDPMVAADDAGSDADGDGLTLAEERGLGTDPTVADTDGDGISDRVETTTTLTSPLDADTDDDGLRDGEETVAGADGFITNPRQRDTDGDGLPDGLEVGIVAPVPDADGFGPLGGTRLALFRADADPATRTNPTLRDTDAGGIADGNEDLDGDGQQDAGETDPLAGADDSDSDGDGLGNLAEARLGLDPVSPDTDGDGIRDGEELIPGADGRVTDPLDADTDDDGGSDGLETATWLTDPSRADTDGDGVLDGTERGLIRGVADPDGSGPRLGTDSRVFVADADPATTTDPTRADHDGGGIKDGNEDLDANGRVDAGETNPRAAADDTPDADTDGIADAAEASLGLTAGEADTDGDGLLDGEERIPGADRFKTDPLDADSDDDGLGDAAEAALGLDPSRRDSDDDGLPDGLELGIAQGITDPDGPGPLRGSAGARFRADADPGTRTDPTRRDTDGGGLVDGAEDFDADGRRGPGETDPLDGSDDAPADLDGDGLVDALEAALGLDPASPDSDGDGPADGDEIFPPSGVPSSDPRDADTDDDGMGDGAERQRSTDPSRADTDGDLIPDGIEAAVTAGVPDPDGAGPLGGTLAHFFSPDGDPLTETDPLTRDTDGGGVADGLEDLDADGRRDASETDPLVAGDDADADGDGVGAAAETLLGTDPAVPDTDGDGLGDGEEVLPGRDGAISRPLDADTDDDGLSDGDESLRLRLDPSRSDTDGDGVADGTEVGTLAGLPDPDGAGALHGTDTRAFQADGDPATRTDPRDADSDGGGVLDGLEDANADGRVDDGEGNPVSGRGFDDVDSDGDGVTDACESALGLVPGVADADGDGLLDGEELVPGLDGALTDPLDADADDDGLSDGEELALGLPPTNPDADGDGLADGIELGVASGMPDPDGPGPAVGTAFGFRGDADPGTTTDPFRADTDGGGVVDGIEDLDRNGRVDPGESDPRAAGDEPDADGDGLADAAEIAFRTSPAVADTDGDTLLDGEEVVPGRDGVMTSPIDADTDDDGLLDGVESFGWGTDAASWDSDGDGLSDGVETGVTAIVADPDGRGPMRGTDLGRIARDADPASTTSPLDTDTDEGGALDSEEDANLDGAIDAAECDPVVTADDAACMSVDADGDGLSDAAEARLGTDPLNPDTDGDRLSDGEEVRLGTLPLDADTDDDGLGDGEEVWPGLDGVRTDPRMQDTDGDALPDGMESGETAGVPDPDGAGPLRGTDTAAFRPDRDPASRTDPSIRDTDRGGIADGNEDISHDGRFDSGETDPVDDADDADDADRDGLTASVEALIGTDPTAPDTDGDGILDGEETIPGDDGETISPLDLDSDDDALTDGDELFLRGTSPSRADTDGDGLQDGTELGLVVGVTDPDGIGPLLGTAFGAFRPDADPLTITDPLDADTDDGSVLDGNEDEDRDGALEDGETDPLDQADDADADDDGLPDVREAVLGTDPLDPDSDDDSILDGEETIAGADGVITLPLDADTDDDGLADLAEITGAATNPSRADTDSDGLTDGVETGNVTPVPDPDGAGPAVGTDPGVFVADADPSTTTDPLDADTDDGGVPDGDEDVDRNGRIDPLETDPLFGPDDLDADGDGLADTVEAGLGTDRFNPDTDGDGMGDREEAKEETDGLITDPLDLDTDDDGLSDFEDRVAVAMHPLIADIDGDGLQDGTEAGKAVGWADPDGAGPLKGTDPAVFQPDLDPTTTTHPLLDDTDNGGVPDGIEDFTKDGRIDPGETDPNDPADDDGTDTDADGLPDAAELILGTRPDDADTDDDGLSDLLDGVLDSDGDGLIDALDPDSDDDGLLDGTEAGVTTPLADTDVARGWFEPDTDPATRTSPDRADTDGGGVLDGAEDRDGDGTLDGGEPDPLDPADDAAAACLPAPLAEAAGPPSYGLRARKAGADVVLSWPDEAALRPDPCLVYRIVVAETQPVDRAAFLRLRTTGRPTATHVGVVGDRRLLRYLVVPYSLSAGEGSWGERSDGTAR